MSNPPPSDSPASRSPGTPRRDDAQRNLERILETLPHELQQLLSEIMCICHSLSSDDTEFANAITRDVYSLLQQMVAAIEAELESHPSSDLRTSSDSWHLLGRLVDAINRHFQIRPRIMFVSEDADMQSAAAAARGIKACFTRFIELLSSDEDRAANVAAFTICLMDTDGDAETSIRFFFDFEPFFDFVHVEKGADVTELDLTLGILGDSCGPTNALVRIPQMIRVRGLYLTGIRMFARFRCECTVDFCVPRMAVRDCAPLCCMLCLCLKCNSICLHNPDV